MILYTKEFGDLAYTPGEEIFIELESSSHPFYFDVDKYITANEDQMLHISNALDNHKELEAIAKEKLVEIISNTNDSYYSVVSYFLLVHKEELDIDDACSLFETDDLDKLTFEDMITRLRINRLGSYSSDDNHE